MSVRSVSHSVRYGVFPGRVAPENKHCAVWGERGLIAYGAHSYVAVLDSHTLSLVQTLDAHPSAVTRLLWKPSEISLDDLRKPGRDEPDHCSLISGDNGGHIFVWDVRQASVLLSLGGILNIGEKLVALGAVKELAFLPSSSDLLSLHASGYLVLWDLSSGDYFWAYRMPEGTNSLVANPFDATHFAAATTQGWIYFLRDVKRSAPPSACDLKYRISSEGAVGSISSADSHSGSREEEGEFVQMQFAHHTRNLMYFVLRRRILVFDSAIHQAIASVPLERARAPFVNIHCSKSSSSFLLALHEDGTVSSWLRRRHLSAASYSSELVALLDATLGGTGKKGELSVISIAYGPNENACVVRSDGSVTTIAYKGTLDVLPPLDDEESDSIRRKRAMFRNRSAGVQRLDLVTSSDASSAEAPVSPPGRLMFSCMRSAVSADIASLCPSPFDSLLVAVGTQNGVLQILDLSSYSVKAEFRVAKHLPVRGVRWVSPQRVIHFIIEPVSDKGRYRNEIGITDIRNGRVEYIRQKSDPEGTFIRGIRPSPLRNFVVVLLKNQPFQIYDLRTGGLMKSIQAPLQITAFAWEEPYASPSPSPTQGREGFVFTTPDGGVHHYVLEQSTVQSVPLSISFQSAGLTVVSSLAWQGQWLVAGDTAGGLRVWSTKSNTLHTINTDKGHIRRVQLEPPPLGEAGGKSDANIHIIGHFNDGSCAIWDISRGQRVSSSNYLSQRGLSSTVVDWIDVGKPLMATSDNALRVMDATSLTTAVNTQGTTTLCPRLLRQSQLHRSRTALLHLGPKAGFLVDLAEFSEELSRVPSYVLASVLSAPSLQHRAKIVAEYHGNSEEADFWTLCAHVFARTSTGSIASSDVSALIDAAVNDAPALTSTLAPYFDLLLDADDFRAVQEERAELHLQKRSAGAYHLTKKVADFQLLLGHKEKAIELLLETQADPKHFHSDALKACVISASIGQEMSPAFQNTVKLVATTLIAQDQIAAGTQLLILIGKGGDACRYLQSYDKWSDAAWLAKVSLEESECGAVLRKWAHHLVEELDDIEQAVLIHLSLGDYVDVILLLLRAEMHERAALFARAASAEGVLTDDMKPAMSYTSTTFKSSSLSMASAYAEYAQDLARVDLRAFADFYISSSATMSEKSSSGSIEDIKLDPPSLI